MEYRISEHVLNLLEWEKIIVAVTSRTTSDPGKVYTRALFPLTADEARVRLELITETRTALIEEDSCDFSGLADVHASVSRAAKGSSLGLDELFAVRSTMRTTGRVRAYFSARGETMPRCRDTAAAIDPCEELTRTLGKAFTEEGELNGSTYPQIGRIEKAIRSVRQEIERTLSKLIHSPSMEDVLQEKIHTTRGDRHVILVKANMKGRVKGTVIDISGSSSTLYVEPDSITPLNDEILLRKAELEREIDKICAELSELTGAHASEIAMNIEIAAYLDFILAAALFSRDINGSAPVITDEPVIDLVHARHPLLSLILKEKTIANDVKLGGAYSCLVITGANTGGKTVLLKTVAISAVMASHGLHLAASPDSRIGMFTSIMADIGDDQNLEMSLSTFSGQIVALNEMLAHSHDRSLVLIDEIMAGTNPRHGSALARAVLEKLAASGAKIAVTTHYPELRDIATDDARFRNCSVSFNVENLKPTYELIMGIPGASFTFEIASKYDMDRSVIERARVLTSSDELSTEALIEKINRYKDEIEARKNDAENLAKELVLQKDRLSETERLLKEETRRVKKGEGISFLDDLRAYREEVARKIKELQSADIRTAGKIQEDLIALEKTIAGRIHEDNAAALREKSGGKTPPSITLGAHVVVIPLEKEGIIEETNDERRIAVVRLGNIFSRFPYDDLLATARKEDATQTKRPAHRRTQSFASGRVRFP
jgi:DNA mismatch repair protein MutS2